MIGVEERWKKQYIPNTFAIKNSIFAPAPASKVLENQAKEKVFIGVVLLVQWRQNHGVNK